MPVGPNKTTAGLSGAIPQQNLTGVTRYTEKRLLFSLREQALILPKTLRGGYGILEMGTLMSVIENDAYGAGTDEAQGILVPYVPADVASTTLDHATHPGVCPVFTATASAAIVYCDLERSWMFQLGDEILLQDADSLEGGTISAIDRTTYDYQAKITLEANIVATFTANASWAYVRCGDGTAASSGVAAGTSVAQYILDQTIDTGYEDQGGALGSVIVSNAIFYTDALIGADTVGIADLGLIADGIFHILK
jgi:hypothetical protein